MTPALAPIDAGVRQALRTRLDLAGRVQIRDVLAPAYADHLAEAADQASYQLTTLTAPPLHYPPDALASMSNDDRARAEGEMRESRMQPHQFYAFDNVAIDALTQLGKAAPVWADLVGFLNSEPMLQLVRDVTGEPRIAFADAQLTRFRRGHFLTEHDDTAEGKNRYCAYVLNLTRRWSVDWGGLLMFHGADGNVEEAYTPAFNVLNLLKVPQLHSVSQVASAARASRLSVTGWYRGR